MTDVRRGPSSRWVAWKRAGRALLACLVVANSSGCPSDIDPALISARVVSFGEFQIQSGMPTLVTESATIACKQGVLFGVDYRIEIAEGAFGTLPIEFRWVHPELAIPSQGLWGPVTPAGSPRPTVEWRQSSLEGRALWSLEHVDELISGRYEFQIRRMGEDVTILSQPFDVEGC